MATLGPRCRGHNRQASGMTFGSVGPRKECRVRPLRVHDVTVFGARGVANEKQVAKGQNLGGKQKIAGGAHARPPHALAVAYPWHGVRLKRGMDGGQVIPRRNAAASPSLATRPSGRRISSLTSFVYPLADKRILDPFDWKRPPQ